MNEMPGVVEHVTCLGCGCACDDIAVVVRDGLIAEARHACPLGAAWFGDGRVPGETRIDGAPATMDAALDAAAAALAGARRALVYLALDISCETQRAAVAIADALDASVDVVSSSTAAAGILASQRRGRVGATLGEIRNRADCLVFWGIDPAARYPRYTSRYAPDPTGLFVPNGRRGRVVVAVDVGASRGPADADTRLTIAANEELLIIAALRATLAGRSLGGGAPDPRAAELARVLSASHYAVIVYDGEPGPQPSATGRAEALLALGQELNATIRASVTALRGGGNRSGAESVLTWQTGFPMAVDFSRGHPRYRPDDIAPELVRSGAVDTVLIVGATPDTVPPLPATAARRIIIGPRASTAPTVPHVAIDTGVAGVHEAGLAFRMDDIPLTLRAPLPGPPVAADVMRALGIRVRAQRPPAHD